MAVVIACSALKKKYRDILDKRIKQKPLQFVFLDIPPQVLTDRVQNRSDKEGHYMPATLVDSQLNDLEKPQHDESIKTRKIITIDGSLVKGSPEDIGNSILSQE